MKQLTRDDLYPFVAESNRIEGITRRPLKREIEAHHLFLASDRLDAAALQAFVSAVQPGAVLRELPGLNVRVGHHVAPTGGPHILEKLEAILHELQYNLNAFSAHVAYERLHPFTDGNGRSGRALWLWQMLREGTDPYALQRGFLHTFYYQTLSESRP